MSDQWFTLDPRIKVKMGARIVVEDALGKPRYTVTCGSCVRGEHMCGGGGCACGCSAAIKAREEEAPAEPSDGQGDFRVVEVTMETLDDLAAAYAACTGQQATSRGLQSPEAMGLILGYLPALLAMAGEVLLADPEPVRRVTTSAHPTFTSAHQ